MISLRAKLIALILYGCAAMAIGAYAVDLKWQSDWDSHMLSDAKAGQKSAEEALTKQKNLLQELDNAYKEQKALKEKHDRNVTDARIAADRLRAELDRIKALPAITHTSTLAERANAATDRRVLAGMLASSDYLAGRFAAEADRNRQAVIHCNNEYNAVRTALNER